MAAHSVLLIGGPDSGKTNYLARLWEALRSGGGIITASSPPEDIKYVEDALAHLLQGAFAPRSDKNLEEASDQFAIPVTLRDDPNGDPLEIVVPDATGELWKAAVEDAELASDWMDRMENAGGALLFVRVLSELNVAPLDWVTAGRLLSMPAMGGDDRDAAEIPTQVSLCELFRFLELTLRRDKNGNLPRVAVLITAWDLLDEKTANLGPTRFLRDQFPLFEGRLRDTDRIEVKVFGVSVVGGDFADPGFQEKFFEGELKTAGYIVTDGGNSVAMDNDLTLPVAWVVGASDGQ